MSEDIGRKCRACGSEIIHTKDYETPTSACISFLRSRMEILDRRLNEYEEFRKTVKETLDK